MQPQYDQQETMRNEYLNTRPVAQQFLFTNGVQSTVLPQQQEEFIFDGRNQAFNYQGNSLPGSFVTAQVTNYPTINPCNPCQASPLHMQIVVVNREEIEAPWRLECEYLQSVITELEARQLETRVVEKVVEKEKIVKDTESILALENQLSQLKLGKETELGDLRRQIQDLQNQNQNLNMQLRQRDSEILMLKSSTSTNDSKAKQLEQEILTWKNNCRQKDNEINILRQQLQDQTDQINQLQLELNSLRMQLQQKIAELDKTSEMHLELRSAATSSRDAQQRIAQLEAELENLKQVLYVRTSENEDLRNKLINQERELTGKINQYKYQISDLEAEGLRLNIELDKLRKIIQSKDQEIDELHLRIQQLEEQGSTVIQERVTFLSSEIEVWKQKFIKINHDYNECQEQLMMCQAELEALQKQSKKEVVVEKRTVTRSTVGSSSVQKQQY